MLSCIIQYLICRIANKYGMYVTNSNNVSFSPEQPLNGTYNHNVNSSQEHSCSTGTLEKNLHRIQEHFCSVVTYKNIIHVYRSYYCTVVTYKNIIHHIQGHYCSVVKHKILSHNSETQYSKKTFIKNSVLKKSSPQFKTKFG